MPESFFILSKDYLELAADEITTITRTFDRFAKIKIISNLIVVQSKTNWKKISERATFVKISGQILRKMSGLFLDEENFQVLKNTQSFVCRVINLSSNQLDVLELEKSMGDMISKFTQAKVNLKNPEITVYLIFGNSETFEMTFSSKSVQKTTNLSRKNDKFETFPAKKLVT